MTVITIWLWAPTLESYPEIFKKHVILFRKIGILFPILALLLLLFFDTFTKIIHKSACTMYFVNFLLFSYEYFEFIKTNNPVHPFLYILRIIFSFLTIIVIPILYTHVYDDTISATEKWIIVFMYTIIIIHNILFVILPLIYLYKQKYTTSVMSSVQHTISSIQHTTVNIETPKILDNANNELRERDPEDIK
jgi:hypothetical protein